MNRGKFLSKLKTRLVFSFVMGACSLGAYNAQAQAAYPDKPIRLVVGFAPGGANDIIGRLVAKELTEELGVSVVVENKPGASSNIGTASVAQAAPDGYTLLLASLNNAINQSLYKNLTFDLIQDFAPIALVATMPNVLVVNAQAPYQSVGELVSYGKAHPDVLTFASSGTGTSLHLAGELFKIEAGLDILHVPYKGSSLATTDLLGGRVDLIFDNLLSALPHINGGKLRPLAITSAQPSAVLPDVPTMAAAGYPNFDVSSWFGVLAPAGTPAAVIEKLNASVANALQKPALRKRLEELGAAPQALSSQAYGEFIKAQVDSWGTVIKTAGVTTGT